MLGPEDPRPAPSTADLRREYVDAVLDHWEDIDRERRFWRFEWTIRRWRYTAPWIVAIVVGGELLHALGLV